MEECSLCASSAHDVHHASVCVNVVIGVFVLHCELHVDVRVHVIPLVVDAVVGLTLGLIALVVIIVFVVAIFHRILLYWRYTVYRIHSISSRETHSKPLRTNKTLKGPERALGLSTFQCLIQE